MRTFDAHLDPRVFWSAVAVPPTVYWIVVEGVAKGVFGGQVSFGGFLALMSLAYGLPLGALVWVLCSVAAYSVEPGRLIVHRVVFDRSVSLVGLEETLCSNRDVVLLRWPERVLRLRVKQAGECLAAVEAARPAPSAQAAG